MGRPPLDIDPAAVLLLAKAFCTNEEIAAKLHCSSDTLVRRFADQLREGRDDAKASLRAKQFSRAMSGSDKMLIWLGKQYLGQTDKIVDFSRLSDDELRTILSGSTHGSVGAGEAQAGPTGTDEEGEIN